MLHKWMIVYMHFKKYFALYSFCDNDTDYGNPTKQ